MDGVRLAIRKFGSVITAINRKGFEIPLLKSLHDAIADIPKDFIIDGELIGESYYAFDCLGLGSIDQPMLFTRFSERYAKLKSLLESHPTENTYLVDVYERSEEKRNFLDALKLANAEGAVFRANHGDYMHGARDSNVALKLKFVESASVIVAAHNQKNCVSMQLEDDTFVGNVTIPANHSLPALGAVVEVQYLYAYPKGSLIQPVYKGLRADVEARECTSDQIKFKRI